MILVRLPAPKKLGERRVCVVVKGSERERLGENRPLAGRRVVVVAVAFAVGHTSAQVRAFLSPRSPSAAQA